VSLITRRKVMKDLIALSIYLALIVSWLAGIVYAKGVALTALAIVFPFYAWYVCVERLLT
jgi:hypothetical protein